jgi:hypothetical protein
VPHFRHLIRMPTRSLVIGPFSPHVGHFTVGMVIPFAWLRPPHAPGGRPAVAPERPGDDPLTDPSGAISKRLSIRWK